MHMLPKLLDFLKMPLQLYSDCDRYKPIKRVLPFELLPKYKTGARVQRKRSLSVTGGLRTPGSQELKLKLPRWPAVQPSWPVPNWDSPLLATQLPSSMPGQPCTAAARESHQELFRYTGVYRTKWAELGKPQSCICLPRTSLSSFTARQISTCEVRLVGPPGNKNSMIYLSADIPKPYQEKHFYFLTKDLLCQSTKITWFTYPLHLLLLCSSLLPSWLPPRLWALILHPRVSTAWTLPPPHLSSLGLVYFQQQFLVLWFM